MPAASPATDLLPRVGVAVIILRGGRVLFGKRRGSHGAGTWALPGGHLEFGESVEGCAIREVAEETGLLLESVRLGPYTNDIFQHERKHYVTLFVVAHSAFGNPEVREPEKCECWAWFPWEQPPEPLFAPLRNVVHSGYVPSEA